MLFLLFSHPFRPFFSLFWTVQLWNVLYLSLWAYKNIRNCFSFICFMYSFKCTLHELNKKQINYTLVDLVYHQNMFSMEGFSRSVSCICSSASSLLLLFSLPFFSCFLHSVFVLTSSIPYFCFLFLFIFLEVSHVSVWMPRSCLHLLLLNSSLFFIFLFVFALPSFLSIFLYPLFLLPLPLYFRFYFILFIYILFAWVLAIDKLFLVFIWQTFNDMY